MKKLLLLIGMMVLLKGAFAQTDSIPKLIISEWRGDAWGTTYMELTNVGDTALDLSDFMLFSSRPYATYSPTADAQLRLSGILQSGESWLAMPVTEALSATGNKTYRELMEPLADLLAYRLEPGVENDIVSPFEKVFRLWKTYFSGIYYHYPSGDSLLIDAVNNAYDPEQNKIGGILTDVAGIPEATVTHILVRKANVKRGNTDWSQARGTSIEDSEWLPIPEEQGGGSNLQHYTTVGVHGNYHIDLTSSSIDINWADTVLTVPWGIQKYDSIMDEFTIGPNMSWHYLESPVVEDSTHKVCQTGDVLQVYALGNTLELMEFDINVVEPTDDCVLTFPLEHMNATPGSWGTRYYVTEETSVMDTIGDVPFAERVDTLMAHIEIASNATWEIIWVDEIERVDLKIGDIFKVIAGDGATTKEYYIDVNDYNKNDNSLLASITWPDMPGFISDAWIGDTIPGFSPTSSAFNVMLPFGITNVPAIVAKPQDVNAEIEVERAVSLSGGFDERTTTYTVTSESDTIVSVYKVTFDVEKDYSNTQPYSPEPFFSELIARQNAVNTYVEIVNSGNTPLFLDNYMIVESRTVKNPYDAITMFGGPDDTDYKNRYMKYVPGYKFTKDTTEWRANPERLIPDANVDPYVAPGDVFVLLRAHKIMAKVSPHYDESDIIFFPSIYTADDPAHPALNPWDEDITEFYNAAEVFLDNHFLFKIVGDSILDGEKGLSDPEDFELVDVFGDPVNNYWTIGGIKYFDNNEGKNLNVILKPEISEGKKIIGEGFGTSPEDTHWNVRSAKVAPLTPWKDLSNNIGFHEMDPVTKYMS
ncbi:MAG: hypothetical protein KAS71_16615, partial [Bacteroidales bacterium]|nr:hypothetical protein [Bacteroidales bacterium]